MTAHRPPHDCPVCGERLTLLRLGCDACGTELAGSFEQCEFCALDPSDRELLRTFLVSRGNMKHLERQLGVSYPTARARFDALLVRLGLAVTEPPPDRLEVLEALARGELDVDGAMTRGGWAASGDGAAPKARPVGGPSGRTPPVGGLSDGGTDG